MAPKSTSVISTTTSHSPRTRTKRDTEARLIPRRVARYAPVPARNTNTGAQKCVTHRVKNSSSVRFRQVFRREQLRAVVEEIADVVERHDHHDDAAQNVDGLDARLNSVQAAIVSGA